MGKMGGMIVFALVLVFVSIGVGSLNFVAYMNVKFDPFNRRLALPLDMQVVSVQTQLL